MSEVQAPEARCFLGFQLAMENIHAECYGLLVSCLDASQREELQLAAGRLPEVQQRAAFAERWLGSQQSFGQRLVVLAARESVFGCAASCAVSWLQRRAQMPGLAAASQRISRDKSLHSEFACLVCSQLASKPQPSTVQAIVREAVQIEKESARGLPVSLVGMSLDWLPQYVEFQGDALLVALGCDKLWGTANPLAWLQTQQGGSWQGWPSEYRLYTRVQRIPNSWRFTLDADF